MSATEQSAVRMYVQDVTSRVLLAQALQNEEAAPFALELKLPRLLRADHARDSFESLQPLRMSDEQALAAALAASIDNAGESGHGGAGLLAKSRPSMDAVAGIAQQEEDTLQINATGTQRFGRVTSAMSNGLAFVEAKLNAIGDAWDAVDNAGEQYTQRFEGLVKHQAAVISSTSRSTYQAVDTTTSKYSQQLGHLVNAKTSAVTSTAKTISQRATLMRGKTEDLAREAALGTRGTVQTAKGKVMTALSSMSVTGKRSSCRGGA